MKSLMEALVHKHNDTVYVPSYKELSDLEDCIQDSLVKLTYYECMDRSTMKMKNPAPFMKKWGDAYRPKEIYTYLGGDDSICIKYTLNGDASNADMKAFFADALNITSSKNKKIFTPIFHSGYPHGINVKIHRRDGNPDGEFTIPIKNRKFII